MIQKERNKILITLVSERVKIDIFEFIVRPKIILNKERLSDFQ